MTSPMAPILNGSYLYAEKNVKLGDPISAPDSVREVTLRFRASDVRKEHTGVHAKVHIVADDVTLAWDQFNIERHQDRQRLVNYAHKRLGTNPPPYQYAPDAMGYDFGSFCDQVWKASLGAIRAEMMEGDSSIPQRWHLFPYILEGAGTILYAPGGRGKSYTALLMTASIDSGITDFWPTEIGKAMYINLERSRASMQRRLGRINQVLGLDERRGLLMFNGRGQSLDSIGEHLAAEIEDRDVEVIILDSISRTGQGKLNADEVANKIADTLNALSSTWLAIAHTPRSDESHIFGSTHFENAADMTVRMHTSQDATKLGVGLEITKANDTGKHPMSVVGYEFGPDPQDGLVKAWPSTETEFPELGTERKKSIAQQIAAYFANEAPEATTAEVAKAINRARNVVSGILANDKRFAVVRVGARNLRHYGLVTGEHDQEMFEAGY